MPKEKKRKRNDGDVVSSIVPTTTTTTATKINNNINTSKPSARFQPKGGRSWTLSIALPGSIIANAQSHDLKSTLVGQIARALAVFCVDEIVVFNDGKEGPETSLPIDQNAYTAFSHPSHFLAHVLSFLETPANLRKAIFPTHPNLKTAGALPSLDMPHHLKQSEWCVYREGVVTSSNQNESYVNVGLEELKVVEGTEMPVNARVTLKLEKTSDNAEVVHPNEPREVAGYYWGYSVRQCNSLSAVLTECPFDGGYDFSIGTSERGSALSEEMEKDLPQFQHLLLVFGGVAGLEVAAANDPDLSKMGITKETVGELFDLWVNVLPGQGSRTIRTEEAVWLGLMGTRRLVENR